MHQYLQRISPPSHREAPIQNNVSDLPDIIHTKTAIHSNVLTFIEGLWNNKVWKSTHCSSGVASSTLQMGPTAAGVNNPSLQCAWNVPHTSDGQSLEVDRSRKICGDDFSGGNAEINLATEERSTVETRMSIVYNCACKTTVPVDDSHSRDLRINQILIKSMSCSLVLQFSHRFLARSWSLHELVHDRDYHRVREHFP